MIQGKRKTNVLDTKKQRIRRQLLLNIIFNQLEMNLKPATILKCSLESTTSNIQKAAILFNYYSFTTQVRTDNQKRCKTTPNSEIAHVQPTTPGSMQKRNTGNFGHVKQPTKFSSMMQTNSCLVFRLLVLILFDSQLYFASQWHYRLIWVELVLKNSLVVSIKFTIITFVKHFR